MADVFTERMRSVDERYGTQAHQRRYVERMHELQQRAPCAQNHEHSARCYPNTLVQTVVNEQIEREKAERKDVRR